MYSYRPNFYSSPREDANIMSLYFVNEIEKLK
jgi:hypothetical protein